MNATGRRLTAYLAAGVLSVTLAAALAQGGAVGERNGLNTGVAVGGYGLEHVGEPGVFHNVMTPPCAEEDSPGPCYWDAATMGNGIGLSYTVDAEQTVHYATERN